ncbi:fructose-1,6-bisphosphatase class 1/Sedoheputulose-1,7-bisphosphatase [Pelagophyceae sp. CCMP2097]|nr:fructose-1,6-bisphosphatase class 1/Sedoheputulose-1,7-bisphosphatase [Pelagophyceae sp. CCMP2097]
MSKTRDTEMAILMNALQLACKLIARAVRKAGVANLYGLAGTANASGDDVKKLDMLSNEIMINALVNSCVCAVLVSEEEEDPIFVSPDKQGKYCVAFDPLDGSSNIDCNVSTGTIFSVYERLSTGTKPNVGDILRPGTDMVCAGYCMYGSACDFVVSFGKGVDRFTLDDSVGEFVHFGPMRFPDAPKTIYSCNEGNYSLWPAEIQKATDMFKSGDSPYSARYVGSMVSDVHRTILYGGIFYYPADSKSTKGKLRVLYEGYPMALITEQAGGVADTGMFKGKLGRILEVPPEHIHDRCPIIMGCQRDFDRVMAFYNK